MPDIWMPGATRHQVHSGGSLVGGPDRCTHHITYDALHSDGTPEGTFEGVAQYLINMAYEPTIIIDPITGKKIQFLPGNRGASALKHVGDPNTNNEGTHAHLQVEWYFTPGVVRAGKRYSQLTDTPMAGLREFLAWCDSWGIPRVARDNRSRSVSEWTSQGGHYGHYGVPENDHTDPIVNIEAILNHDGANNHGGDPTKHPTTPPGIPAFPFPGGYIGTTRSDVHCHSGYYPADRRGIAEWQVRMNHLGYRVRTDGHYDAGCAQACGVLQTKKHLPKDYLVGPNTWRATFN